MSTHARASSTGSTERSNDKRRLGGLLAILALALCALGSSASMALATTGHSFADQFGGGAFNFAAPAGIAVDQTTGDVFASDPYIFDPSGNYASRVERFDSAGVLQDQNAIVLDGSQYILTNNLASDPSGPGVLYVAASRLTTGEGVVLKYSTAGTFSYALDPTPASAGISNPAGLAVDPLDGTVYVSGADNNGQPVVLSFDDTGTYLGKFDGSNGSPDGAFAGNVTSLAVDGSHHLYALDSARSRVDRYSAAGVWEATIDDGSHGTPTAVTVDQSSDEVFVTENGPAGTQVGWFSAGGAARLETFGAGHIAGSSALAVNESTGTVYTADSGQGAVERFPTFAGPTVSTAAPTGVSPTEATFNGTINPEGIDASSHFEYGQDLNYGSATPDVPAGSGSTDVPASDTATGLFPNTLYHVRIVGTNASGSIYGEDKTFTTDPAPPILDASPPLATAITVEGATLNGTINPRGSETAYHFDYGTTTAYGSATPNASAGSGQGDAALTAGLTGLAPATTYHFRLSADNGTDGVQHGVDQTFTTAPAAPADATEVTPLSATLNGTIDPHGSAATYHFEYGITTAYGLSTPETDAGSGNGEEAVSWAVDHLSPGTTYHVRLVATDTASGVTTTGADGTFATVPAPVADTGDLTDLTGAHAAFSGAFDTHEFAGSYRFFVRSTTGTYLGKTEAVPIEAGAGPGEATGALDDLPPGQTYEVRLSVTSAGVSSLGDAVEFSTAPPPLLPAPPMPAGDNRPAPPANAFGLSGKAKAKAAKLSVTVPGPGTIAVSGKGFKATSKHASDAGTVAVTVSLKAKALKALKANGKLSVTLQASFTPTGGIAASKTLQLSFQRKAAHR
ncbi:MAG TPA: NHL repeat-containing protein [Solirubrobacterales bacterium]|nr:NHL repeat-containing protein [Solirubrobacterales bacterium]